MANVKKKKDIDVDRLEDSNEYFILMGDIIKSSQYEYEELRIFKKLIDEVNKDFNQISPLTITLGDEFQGIATSLTQGVEMIFRIEEKLIKNSYPFELRYALGFGEIITPINNEIAHGMYGKGLTQTRDLLEKSKKDKRRRIDVFLPLREFNNIINDLFFVYQSFLDNWKERDYGIIKEFYENRDYKEVAKKLGKGSDQIWKREKNLRIREFFEMQDIILKFTKSYTRQLSNSKNNNSKLQNNVSDFVGELVWKSINEHNGKKVTKKALKEKLVKEQLFKETVERFTNDLINLFDFDNTDLVTIKR